jgi:dTDP-4-dehydrorhamnose 3,5-epimerase
MKFEETSLPGVFQVTPSVFGDDRGFLMETWHSKRFAENGIDAHFVQDNFSQSSKGSLRGIHFQLEQSQGKLIRVVSGDIFDVAVDLRRSSPQFGKWVGVVLSAANKRQLWIPPGFGHGFLVLSELANVDYKCTDYYAPEFERAIRWNDPDIDIKWPIDGDVPLTLSNKDSSAPFLKDADTYE